MSIQVMSITCIIIIIIVLLCSIKYYYTNTYECYTCNIHMCLWEKSFEAVGLFPPQPIVFDQCERNFYIPLALFFAFMDNL